jgi:hypothetical protein
MVMVWFTVQLWHYAKVEDWEGFLQMGKSAFTLLAPYFLGVFTRFGLIQKQQ